MGSIYAEDVIKIALNEVGYTEGANNWNKYARDLDAVNYFVGCGKKQNLPWCCVFTNWCVFKASDSSSASGKKWDAINFQFQSSSCNTSAVVSYYKNFFKKKGRIYATPRKGDIAFYGNSHVGIVVAVNGSNMTVVEGNTGNAVKKKVRPISDSGCFGRPSYDKKPTPPTPTPGKHYDGEWPTLPVPGTNRYYYQRYDKGECVKDLQRWIKWMIPSALPVYGIDGDIGSETLGAVKDCQKILGVKVDGFFGRDTLKAAKEYTK